MAKVAQGKRVSVEMETNPVYIHMEKLWMSFKEVISKEIGAFLTLDDAEEDLRPFFEEGFHECMVESARRLETGDVELRSLGIAAIDAVAMVAWLRVSEREDIPQSRDRAGKLAREVVMACFVQGFRAGTNVRVVPNEEKPAENTES